MELFEFKTGLGLPTMPKAGGLVLDDGLERVAIE